ncbi:MAG: histidine phosphatase family protein [Candidatus Gracilibacteria bacterium]|nr:histidine phosphatase family protein [Candidatus Gracilibacteria bacterium]MDD2909172.1 histidine phosphatase family protein [Candidatus Gracilibacteria bacterium]
MKIYITRHGRTLENIAGIFQGHIDGTLSEEGISQAKKLGERFKNIKIDVIYCSPTGRTKDTLKEILGFKKDTKVEYTIGLIERDTGDATGKTADEIDFSLAKGVETNMELKIRAGIFLDSIIKKHINENILFVTHGGFIKWLFAYIHDLSEEEMIGKYISNNCSVSLIEINNGHVLEIYFNDVSHI